MGQRTHFGVNVGFALAAIIALGGGAAAAQVVEYGFLEANAGKAPSLAIVKHDPAVEASALVAVGTSGPLDYVATLFYSSWPTAGSGLDENQYYEFTISPVEPATITYRSITFSLASGGKGEPRVEIRASTDGFAESNLLLRGLRYPANTTFQTARGVDISTLGTHSGPVTFRVYMEKGDSGFAGIGNTDAFGGGANVVIDGVVSKAGS